MIVPGGSRSPGQRFGLESKVQIHVCMERLIWKLIWYTKSALSKESMLSSESIVESKIKRSEAQERLLVLPIVTRVGVVY